MVSYILVLISRPQMKNTGAASVKSSKVPGVWKTDTPNLKNTQGVLITFLFAVV